VISSPRDLWSGNQAWVEFSEFKIIMNSYGLFNAIDVETLDKLDEFLPENVLKW
jgi:hypothetical protein